MNLPEYSDRFDLDLALNRFSGDRELLSTAIAIYKEEAAKHLTIIKEALGNKDWKKAATYAHTLKGESGAVGAIRAQLESEFLEKALRNSDLTNINEIYEQVAEEISIALKTLPEEI